MVKSTKRNNHKKKKGGRKTRQKGGVSPGSSRGPFDSINSFYARNTAPPPIMQDLYDTARKNNPLIQGESPPTNNEIVDAPFRENMPIMRDPFSITTGVVDGHHRESAFEGADVPEEFKGTSALSAMMTEREQLDKDMRSARPVTSVDINNLIEQRERDLVAMTPTTTGFGDFADIFGKVTPGDKVQSREGQDLAAFQDEEFQQTGGRKKRKTRKHKKRNHKKSKRRRPRRKTKKH